MNETPREGLDLLERLLRAGGPREEVPRALMERTRAAVLQQWKRRVRVRQRRRLLRLAAVLAGIAILAAWQLYPLLRSPGPRTEKAGVIQVLLPGVKIVGPGGQTVLNPETNTILNTGSRLVTDSGGRLMMELPDGTTLRVGTGSILRLEAGNRFHLQEGTVYLDSGALPDGSSDFRLVTPYGTVRHVGTQYEARAGDHSLRVRVREGLVEIEHRDRVIPAPRGTEVRISASGITSGTGFQLYGPDWDWISGMPARFDLEGQTLNDFLQWMSREMGYTVQYSPAVSIATQATVLHGSLDGLTYPEMLKTVLPACGVAYRVENGILRIELE